MAKGSGIGGVLAAAVVIGGGVWYWRKIHASAAAHAGTSPASTANSQQNSLLQQLLKALQGSKGGGGLSGGGGSTAGGAQTRQSNTSGGPGTPSFADELNRADTLQTQPQFNQMNPFPDVPTDTGGVAGSLADYFGFGSSTSPGALTTNALNDILGSMTTGVPQGPDSGDGGGTTGSDFTGIGPDIVPFDAGVDSGTQY